MKMSLSALQVDSHATALNDSEISNIKGGTSAACVEVAINVVGVIVNAMNSGSKSCTTTTTTTTKDGETTTVTKTVCK